MKGEDKYTQKKLLKFFKTIVISRMFIIIILLLIQFAFYFTLFFKFEELSEYFGYFNLLVSIFFFIYLYNQPGKNEFKLTWLFPILIMPVFGILLYIFLKTNFGGFALKKELNKTRFLTDKYFFNQNESSELSSYPKISDLAIYLSKSCKNPSFAKNKLKYFPSGELAFEDIKNELKNAQKFIFMEYFIIEPSQIWNEILEILKEKASKGVEIRILYDSVGSLDFSSPKYEQYLKRSGINAKIFMRFVPIINTGLNNRDHRKILVIDGKTCYTGGINISDEYANLAFPRFDYWKDIAVKINGPCIESFTMMFLQLWHVSHKTLKKNHSEELLNDFKNYAELPYEQYDEKGIAIPYCDDAYNDEDVAENVYLYMIQKAQKYVHIMTPYIVIDNFMLDELCFAAKRGVEVSIIVPKHYDHYVTFCVGRTYIKTLVESGVKVYEYNPGFIHAKLFISDASTSTVGSVNLDFRSFYHHFECGILFHESDEISKCEEDFQNTLKDSTLITPESYKKLSPVKRITGRCARIISPLL